MCHTKHFRGAIFHPSHLLVLHRRHIPFQTGRRVAFQVSDAVVSVTFTISVFPRGHDIKSPQIADPRPPSPFSTITPGGWLRVPKGKKRVTPMPLFSGVPRWAGRRWNSKIGLNARRSAQ